MNPVKKIVVARPVPIVVSRIESGNDEYAYIIDDAQSREPLTLSEAEMTANYLPAGNIVDLPEYVQHIHIERAQLIHYLDKVSCFISTTAFLEMPGEARDLIERQLNAMTAYRRTLDEWIEHFREEEQEKSV